MLSFESQVGKMKMDIITGGFTVIFPNFILFFLFWKITNDNQSFFFFNEIILLMLEGKTFLENL